MSLQYRVASILLAVFALFGALDYGVQRLVLAPSFLALEREEVQKNVDRAVQAVQREAQLLAPSATDWAVWDDTYRFVADRNHAYVETNLTDEALEGLKVHFMALYDRQGRRVWGKAVDPASGEPVELRGLSSSLPPGHPLLEMGVRDGGFGGVYEDGGRLLLLVGHPILTSARTGPARGVFLLGRVLDGAAFGRIAEQARLKLMARPMRRAPDAAWLPGAAAGLRHTAPVLREREAVTLATTVLGDVTGRPVLELEVETPRAITRQGATALRFASLSLLGIGLGVLLILMALLRAAVLRPLDRLTRHATRLGERGDLTDRLAMDRADELGTLARAFDGMVERLAEARRELLDQSYRSGVAEMASGVLHNIGNAVTPLKVGLATLLDRLRTAPARELEQAFEELARADTPADRRALLGQFAELAGRELAALVRQAPEELGTLSRQVEHVQQILRDQQRFSRAAPVLEPLSLAEVVGESLELLGEGVRRELSVRVDPSVTAAGRVTAAGVALQQVVVNLLVNAVDAVREASRGPGGGLLTVSASPDAVDGRPAVRLRFTDNGVGIPAEHLTRVFERGFSTKSRRSSGLGLHWSAVTVGAMGGRLFAESEGRGAGASFHLVLPLSPEPPEPRLSPGGG